LPLGDIDGDLKGSLPLAVGDVGSDFTGSLPCLEGDMGGTSIAGVGPSFTSITTLASNAIWGKTLDPANLAETPPASAFTIEIDIFEHALHVGGSSCEG
jgi:hypothetical protein